MPELENTRNTVANVSSIYYNNNVGQPIEIYGNLLANGNFILTEFSIKDEDTHQFNFQKKGSIYSGTWQHAKTKKKLVLSLNEVIDNKLNLVFEHISAEDCSDKNKV